MVRLFIINMISESLKLEHKIFKELVGEEIADAVLEIFRR